jgi:hypothetical protein
MEQADVVDTVGEKPLPVFGPDSTPYEITYAEWAAKWWNCALEIPRDRNPISYVIR